MSGNSQKFTSLAAATVTGAGVSRPNVEGRKTHLMQVIVTGAPDTCVVNLEGSLDNGTTWGVLATWDITTPLVSGALIGVGDAPADDIRANLSALTGGTAPTATAIIKSV